MRQFIYVYLCSLARALIVNEAHIFVQIGAKCGREDAIDGMRIRLHEVDWYRGVGVRAVVHRQASEKSVESRCCANHNDTINRGLLYITIYILRVFGAYQTRA